MKSQDLRSYINTLPSCNALLIVNIGLMMSRSEATAIKETRRIFLRIDGHRRKLKAGPVKLKRLGFGKNIQNI